jgi:dTDP-4-amino-4,6-dideoxygalactose transaminase
MRKKKIPILQLNYSKNEKRDISKGINEILNSGYLTMSKKVFQFEKLFAKYVGTKYAVAVNSGTSALEIPLRALNVEGKSIIIPTNTFMATPLAAIHAGANVIFADISEKTLSIKAEEIEKKITKNTVGIILVHIGGIISNEWTKIKKICASKKIFILEDAAHAHGSKINNKYAGNLGIAAAFSFYPTKVLTTGEGGMITTNDKKLYQKFLILRDHGKQNPLLNIHTELGSNWRLSEIQGLLGVQQVKKAKSIVSERIKIALMYDKILKTTPNIKLLQIPPYIKSSYYKYIIFVNKKIRSKIKKMMYEKFGISLPGEVYNHLCHSQPVFKKYKSKIIKKGDYSFKVAKKISSEQLCLPLYLGLKKSEIRYIANSLTKTIKKLT